MDGHYLTAGASYRQSDAWKKRFLDDSGSARILRAGRFGIGILSGFLLGDRIQVFTRHIEAPEDKGIQFEFGLDDTNVEMRWLTRKVGTTVKIRTTKSVVERLMDRSTYTQEKWDWYCLEQPVLVRRGLDGKEMRQKHSLPGVEGPLTVNWHRIQVPGFQAIDWSYQIICLFVCNGLLIPYGDLKLETQFAQIKSQPWHQLQTHLSLVQPTVSIFDPDGRLPLSLARNRLGSQSGELNSHLVDDLCRNFIAHCLIKGPQSPVFSGTNSLLYLNSLYPGIPERKYAYSGSEWLFFSTPDGFGLSDPWNISHFASQAGLVIRAERSGFEMSKPIAQSAIAEYGLTLPVKASGALGSFDSWHRPFTLSPTIKKECFQSFSGLNVKGLRILMPVKWYERFIEKQPRFVVNFHQVESKTPEWVIMTVGECSNTGTSMVSLAKELEANQIPFESATEFFLSPQNVPPKPGRIAQMWKDLVGQPIIPFDKEKREELVAKLDERLKDHLAEWKK